MVALPGKMVILTAVKLRKRRNRTRHFLIAIRHIGPKVSELIGSVHVLVLGDEVGQRIDGYRLGKV